MSNDSKNESAVNRDGQVKPYWQNFINGRWVDAASGERIDVLNPATGEKLTEIAAADSEDVNQAVAAARAVADARTLATMRPGVRGRMLIAAAGEFRRRKEEIATVLTLDAGKSITEARGEIEGTARYLEYYGGAADKIEGRYIPLGAGLVDYVVPVPYGVSAHIIPWNYPSGVIARSIAPALAAGNALVVKTPELDPLCGTFFAEILNEVGFPEGSINVICGHGSRAGAALVGHKDVNQITFTGSVPTGQSVMRAAIENIVPCVMELGGKSAAIVFPDADLDAVEKSVRWGIFENSGQVCNAMSRLIVHRDIYDNVVDRLAGLVHSLKIGPGIEDNDITPVISASQLQKIQAACDAAKAEGATFVTGGKRIDRPGFFMEPTLVRDVSPSMRVAQQEIFGPVLVIIPFNTPEEAIAIANGTEYGLAAGVFTNNLDMAMWTVDLLQAGQVYVNEWEACGCETPFGGMKKSGYGREKGMEALASYYQSKLVGMRIRRS